MRKVKRANPAPMAAAVITGSTMDMTVIFAGRRAGSSRGRYDGPRSPRAPGETEGGPGLFFGGISTVEAAHHLSKLSCFDIEISATSVH